MMARLYLVDPDWEDVGTWCPPFCTSVVPRQGTETSFNMMKTLKLFSTLCLVPLHCKH